MTPGSPPHSQTTLALNGGTPVFTGAWPRWPFATDATLAAVTKVLDGGRWALTGPYTGAPPLDRVLGGRLAELLGMDHCVVLDHGSSALVAALYALGVGPGDEVIVPALTWVACATAVCRLGAVPVLVDIDDATLTADPSAIDAAVTTRTRAVMAVHLYGSMADVDRIGDLGQHHDLAVLEDVAHVPGASWRGRPAGSFGAVSAMSMQQGKLLTAGEGGAAATSDTNIATALEIIRTDGRRYLGDAAIGEPDLVEVGIPAGWNMCLSEIHAAIALDALDRFADQSARRAVAATALDNALPNGVEPVAAYSQNDGRTFYHYAVRVSPQRFAGHKAATIGGALTAELGAWIHPPYAPLTTNPLYQPHLSPLWRRRPDAALLDPSRFHAPVALAAHESTLVFHHSLLLGDDDRIGAILSAFEKVTRLAHTIEVDDRPTRVADAR